jgi:CO/xanthine dehydrogenase FAD-binding subunit
VGLLQLTFMGETVTQARTLLGGVTPVPFRATTAEVVLLPKVILTRRPAPSYKKVALAALLTLVSRFSASYTRL